MSSKSMAALSLCVGLAAAGCSSHSGSGTSSSSSASSSSGSTASSVSAGATSGSGRSGSGASVGSSGSGTGSTSSGPICTVPAFTLDNGDIGALCTGVSDGGVGQGSCAAGELCMQYLSAAFQCTALCSSSACPGSATCNSSNNLCVATCLPSQGNCPAQMVCSPTTPNPLDPGVCQPPCSGSSECNAINGGSAMVCSQGICKCTSDNDCFPGSSCDAKSGSCFYDCGSFCAAGGACCAQVGSTEYCDFNLPGSAASTGSASSTGSSGSTGAFSVGAHDPWPQVPNGDGGVLSQPQLVTVTFDGDPFRTSLESWAQWVMGSSWLSEVGADYGVEDGGTPVFVHLHTAPPSTIDDSFNTDGGLSQFQTFIDGLFQGGQLPPDNDNTLYMFYFPGSTNVSMGGASSCSAFGGYHAGYGVGYPDGGGYSLLYAEVSECDAVAGVSPQFSNLATLRQTEIAASHELIEASSDPGGNSWVLTDYSNPWTFTFGEIGDLCVVFNQGPYIDPTGAYAAQRIWSNSAARGNGSPCVPVPTNDSPFFAESVDYSSAGSGSQEFQVNPGSSVTIKIDGWSTSPAPPWVASVSQVMGGDELGGTGPQVVISPETIDLSNGGTGEFTVTMPSDTPSGNFNYAVLYVQAYLSPGQGDTMYWPVVVFAP